MIFEKPIQEIISKRKSKRVYLDKAIEKFKFKKIEEFLSDLSTDNYEFSIVTTSKKDKKLGTYGMIKGANTFIVSLMKKTFIDFSQFGYDFEKLILYLTSLEISTCWLAGTFNRKHFSNAITLEDDFYIPIVTPIGYSSTDEGLIRGYMRKKAKLDNRKNWESIFFENDLDSPLKKDIAPEFKEALEMVRLGPSASNKQPWIIIKNNDDYDFYLNRTPNYAKSMKFDVQKNDIGIAMCHFEMTLKENGINGIFEDKNKTNSFLEYVKSWSKV
jgi:hypothetical protein